MSDVAVMTPEVTVTAGVQRAPGSQADWTADTARLVCRQVRDEAPNVKTFTLAPEDGSRIRFQAGQNLTLEWARAGGETEHRTFTIASAPTRTDAVEITVKAAAMLGVTRDMHERLVPGTALRAHGPGGRFGLAFAPAKKVLLVGSGSGMTPMMSMLRWVRDRGYEVDLVLVQAARTLEDVLFQAELAQIDAAMANVDVHVVPSRVPTGRSWFGLRGRLDRRMLNALVPDARSRETFCCGPTGFMETVRRALAASGQDPARFHTESFGAPPPSLPPAATSGEAISGETISGERWTARLVRCGREVELSPDRTILASLKEAGIVLPFGCRSGICGTCRTLRTSGTVAMQHQGGLTPGQETAGDILACCSYPTSDLVLEL